jgi:hypothetical protein
MLRRQQPLLQQRLPPLLRHSPHSIDRHSIDRHNSDPHNDRTRTERHALPDAAHPGRRDRIAEFPLDRGHAFPQLAVPRERSRADAILGLPFERSESSLLLNSAQPEALLLLRRIEREGANEPAHGDGLLLAHFKSGETPRRLPLPDRENIHVGLLL